MNRKNVQRNIKVKNRVEEINLAASMSRAVRRLSIFSQVKDLKINNAGTNDQRGTTQA